MLDSKIMISSSAVPAAALELLIEQGFDATSVDQLAAAAGISRSTFFRRFGSKEDMVFADQEMIITHLQTLLRSSSAPALQALVEAVGVVFDQYTANPPAAQLRHQLLQEVPALRERELVSTHRFERAFNGFLNMRQLFDSAETQALRLGISAGIVAIHNDHLRSWLRENTSTSREALAEDARRFLSRFSDVLAPETQPVDSTPSATVVISVIKGEADHQQILEQVSRALNEAHGK